MHRGRLSWAVASPASSRAAKTPPGTTLLTAAALVAFAANSLLGRAALHGTHLDVYSFTSIRLVSGAVALALIVHLQGRRARPRRAPFGGSLRGGLALIAYALPFSFAYVQLDAGAGALILFAAVQTTMILAGLLGGERLSRVQGLGFLIAAAGLVGLMLPGATAPALAPALAMLFSGVGWGLYSLLGRGATDPTRDTSGNFARAAAVAVALNAMMASDARFDARGAALAITSGALTSGIGYALWYAVLPRLRAMTAATLQLSVPILAAALGAVLLGEPITTRLAIASVAVLGGIGLYLRAGQDDVAPHERHEYDGGGLDVPSDGPTNAR